MNFKSISYFFVVFLFAKTSFGLYASFSIANKSPNLWQKVDVLSSSTKNYSENFPDTIGPFSNVLVSFLDEIESEILIFYKINDGTKDLMKIRVGKDLETKSSEKKIRSLNSLSEIRLRKHTCTDEKLEVGIVKGVFGFADIQANRCEEKTCETNMNPKFCIDFFEK